MSYTSTDINQVEEVTPDLFMLKFNHAWLVSENRLLYSVSHWIKTEHNYVYVKHGSDKQYLHGTSLAGLVSKEPEKVPCSYQLCVWKYRNNQPPCRYLLLSCVPVIRCHMISRTKKSEPQTRHTRDYNKSPKDVVMVYTLSKAKGSNVHPDKGLLSSFTIDTILTLRFSSGRL